MTTRLRQRWLLAVLVAGQFMANVDIAIVNVATPSIHRELHASGGALEFVVSGYVLAFAMLIITGARLGRIAGYRRTYLAGLAGFTLASLACSLAPGAGALIGARIAQGAFAAIMVPQVLTGIQVSFEGRARARRSASW
jgi:MFS family permease